LASDPKTLLDFVEAQKTRQASHFPTVKFDKVLTFMGTTSQPGTHEAVSILPVVRLEPGASPAEMRVHLRGALPRPLSAGECITVHVDRLEQYQGYQIKTKPLAAPGTEDQLFRASGKELLVEGRQIYTVHHSPYTMKFFEQIPFDEVQQLLGGVKYAFVGVGETANISPRFVFHWETKLDRLVLYHGDGLALKTYMNLKQNRQETRLLVDLDSFEGYALRGTVEEFAPHQHPEAYDRICQGFTAGSWGRPSRVFRFVADQWSPLAPFRG
jgi:hypothetical protein